MAAMVASTGGAQALGFADPAYAASLAEWGEPWMLPASGGTVLLRAIPGADARDATGPYPFLACRDWDRLCEDVGGLPVDLVSLTFVADPFGSYDLANLRRCLDRMRSFKERYVTDLSIPLERRIAKRHRRTARRASRSIDVDVVLLPIRYLDEWCELYANTVQRFAIRDMRAFSRRSFETQLRLPGMVMFRAIHQGESIASHLWLQRGDVAYGHLAGTSELGYRLGAAYALYWEASRWFTGRCAWLDLGGSPGIGDPDDDGLDYFKRGWATGTRSTYLATLILDRAAYRRLAGPGTPDPGGYFPAYRSGEYG
jgi:hypothetical protein